jgi:hypothetical protein
MWTKNWLSQNYLKIIFWFNVGENDSRFRRMPHEMPQGTAEKLAGMPHELFAEYCGCLAVEANLITVKTLDKFNFALGHRAKAIWQQCIRL